jgi:hypothetical protein
MSDNNKLIPFGKYKGQPIEVLAEDKQYADWIVAQPWFRERYGNLYAVIINNFCEPSETPDHNALQARFLDDDFRLKFSSIAVPRLWWFTASNGEMAKKACDWILSKIGPSHIDKVHAYPGCKFHSFDQRRFSPIKNDLLFKQSGVTFESESVDAQWAIYAGIEVVIDRVRNESWWHSDGFTIAKILSVEIKPEVGDDYPSILRQMRSNGSTFLFTRSYVGSGVDQPTFIQFMDSQGIRVIFESEVDAADSPRIDTFNHDQFMELVKQSFEIQKL